MKRPNHNAADWEANPWRESFALDTTKIKENPDSLAHQTNEWVSDTLEMLAQEAWNEDKNHSFTTITSIETKYVPFGEMLYLVIEIYADERRKRKRRAAKSAKRSNQAQKP